MTGREGFRATGAATARRRFGAGIDTGTALALVAGATMMAAWLCLRVLVTVT